MKKNNGITLIALVITIVVMAILISVATISVTGKNGVDKQAKINKKYFELQEVGQAVLEAYIKYKQTGDTEYLVGMQCTLSDINTNAREHKSLLKDSTYSHYYLLNTEANLERIGIKDAADFYIVNYETGEVLNYTTLENYDGKVLYLNGKE